MTRFDVRVDFPTSVCFIHEYGSDQAVAVKRGWWVLSWQTRRVS